MKLKYAYPNKDMILGDAIMNKSNIYFGNLEIKIDPSSKKERFFSNLVDSSCLS